MKFAHCLCIVFVIGKYADIFQRGGGCAWGGFLLGESSGEGSFRGVHFSGKFYAGGIWQNSCSKFFLVVLHSLCQFNFVCGDVPWAILRGFDLEEKFPGKEAFLKWSRNRLEIKVFFKWKYAKENFYRLNCLQ